MNVLKIETISESSLYDFGKMLSEYLLPNMTVFLKGDLGAGKTTLSRGVLHGKGHEGKVKSPTYNILENYNFDNFIIYHFDLYRVKDLEELEFMGFRDYFHKDSICLIEWPEIAMNILHEPDLVIDINFKNDNRVLYITSKSKELLSTLTQKIANEN